MRRVPKNTGPAGIPGRPGSVVQVNEVILALGAQTKSGGA
jgi:hypothetical protein